MKNKYEFEFTVSYASGKEVNIFHAGKTHSDAMISYLKEVNAKGSVPFGIRFTGNYQLEASKELNRPEPINWLKR